MHRHEHVVQLYGSDDRQLTRNVGRYLAEGFARGEGLLLIATPPHTDAIVSELSSRGIDVPQIVREGRFEALDAETLLAQFLVEGMPDARLFEGIVAPALRGIRRSSGNETVCAYGEMVGLLWTAGALAAAERLEQLWNAIIEAGGLRLYCAYAIDVLGRGCDPAGLASILRSHSAVVPSAGDLQSALNRAMRDVLGDDAGALQTRLTTGPLPSAATAEAVACSRSRTDAHAKSWIERATTMTPAPPPHDDWK